MRLIMNISIYFSIISLSTGTEMIDELVDPKSYRYNIRPFAKEKKPVLVKCSLRVNEVTAVSEIDMDFTILGFFRQVWTDPRLSYKSATPEISVALGSKRAEQIWRPDTYFRNEKNARRHMITMPNVLINLYPNGTIYYSQRLTLKLSCHMNFQHFPFDSQDCHVEIESIGHTIKDIQLLWTEPLNEAVRNKQTTNLAEFLRPCIEVLQKNVQYVSGNYTVLEAKFTFRRDYGFYITQTYLPNILVVVLSWTSFWLDVNATPARISLGIITVLTMTTQSTSMQGMLPKVSYTKAIDVWMITCLLFVFAAFLEFAVSNTMSRKHFTYPVSQNDASIQESTSETNSCDDNLPRTLPDDTTPIPSFHNTLQVSFPWTLRRSNSYCIGRNEIAKSGSDATTEHTQRQRQAEACKSKNKAFLHNVRQTFLSWNSRKLERFSRITFPLLFGFFNVGYWTYYCLYIAMIKQSSCSE